MRRSRAATRERAVAALDGDSGATSNARVTAVVGANAVTLTKEFTTLPAAPVIVDVASTEGVDVLLDGRLLHAAGSRVLTAVDLTRSTGFHRLQVGRQTFWFATEDAKLRLDGIEQMLATLRTSGTGWSGQLLFSDGVVLRDPHVVYSWLDRCADATLECVRRIIDAPLSISRSDRKASRRGGRSLHQTATTRLLRARPDRYLEQSPTGLLTLGGKRYDPLRVVVRTRTTSVESVANRRAVSLVSRLDGLASEVLASNPAPHVAERCRSWRESASRLQRRPLARTLTAGAPVGALAAPRQTEEVVDARYRETYRLSVDLAAQFGWAPTQQMLPRFSYVERADTIYQAFVATALADALNLAQTTPVLGQTPIAFTGDDYEIYYDTHPDPAVLRSWRHESAKPDASRPDVLLRSRSSGEVLVIDAKYRVEGTQATEDSRKEVSAYMALYGLDTVVIAYPGQPPARCTVVTGQGKTILELPIGPWPGLEADLIVELPRLIAAMRPPTY
jgi:hypothetical protein